MKMQNLKRSFQIVQEMQNGGELIDTIRLQSADFSDDDYVDFDNEYKCLGGCFEPGENRKVYWARMPERNFTIYTIKDEGKNYYRYSNEYYKNEEIHKILQKYRLPAQFGDTLNEETRIDPNVRKGFDIPLADHIKVERDVIDKVSKAFANATGLNSVRVEPYKINIYEQGDFFKAHRDSPSKDLIATIVLHVSGERKVFVVDGQKWDDNDDYHESDLCIFFTDVLHEVKPCKDYRETVTFKVFKAAETVPTDKVVSDNAKRIANRIQINKPFGVLLQHGYTYIDIADKPTFKGLDEKLATALDELGVKYALLPVIVKNRHNFKEGQEMRWFSNEEREEYNGDPEEVSNLYIYNLSEKLVHLLEMKEWKKVSMDTTVYYLGMGFKVGEKMETELYVGNQYDGTAIENIYLNVMLHSV